MKSWSSWNSWPTRLSASRWFGETRNGSAPVPEAERLAFRIEDRLHAATVQVPDRLAVEAFLDAARQRAGEDDGLGSGGQVAKLLEEHLQLLFLDMRAPLVDLRVRRRRGVDDRRRGAGLVGDAHEVVEDRLGGQLLDDARAGEASSQARGHDRHVEPFQRPGDVDSLAAGDREPAAGPVPLAALEIGDRERPVERGIERDGDDQETQLHMLSCRLTRVPAGSLDPARLLDGLGSDERRPRDHSPTVEDAHLAQSLTLSHWELDAFRCDHALHERTGHEDGAANRLRRDERDLLLAIRCFCLGVHVPGRDHGDDSKAREPPLHQLHEVAVSDRPRRAPDHGRVDRYARVRARQPPRTSRPQSCARSSRR